MVQAQGERRARAGIEQLVRFLPIRWRIFSIAALNTAVVLIIAALIWDGAKVLGQAWQEVRHVRQSDQLLALLGGEAGRLQDLIHRYINQPSPEIFGEILLRREALLSTLMSRGSADPMLAGSVGRLTDVTEQFLAGFNDLRAVQSAIADTYQNQILKPSKDMAGLYGLIEAATVSRDDLIWPALGKSHEAFTAALLAANVYYLSPAPNGAEEARSKLASIEQTIPVLVDLARSDLQRNALTVLRERTATFQQGLTELGDKYTTRARLLRDEVDASQAAMIGIIDGLSAQMRVLEQNAQARFDRALGDVYRKVGFVALIFLAFIMLIATAVARSISTPLHQLRDAMFANITGDHQRRVVGTEARDEIGDMARAVEVFRENAIAKGHAEDELRAAKDRAERARADIAAARADAERTREILQTVLDNMNDGVMMFDKHFRWQFVNRQLMTFQRFPAEVCYPGASGYDILRFQAERGDFGPTDDIERTVEERAAVLRNSAGSRYERRTASGRYIEFNFNPIEDGGTLAVYRDITELKDREEALTAARAEAERTREMLQTVLDNMSDCVILFDKDLRGLFFNPKLAEFLQLPDEVAAAARFGASGYDILRFQAERGDFGVGDDLEQAVRERAAIMTNPAGSRYERRTASGRYVEFNFKPLKEGGTLGVYRDITQIREREEALAAAKEAAEQARDAAERTLTDLRAAQQSLIEAEKLAALGSLVAGVAHEVNNPVGISLTVASSFARRCEVFAEEVREGALRRSRLDDFIEQSRDAAHQLVANLQRAGELIQSFKQVAVDRSHAERRVFDLRESTEQIIVSLRPGLKSLPVTLAVRVPDDITMDSYPGPYGQVLTNLVLNAVAHGFAEGRSGTIVLRARLSDPHHVEITFTDDGAGMTEDIQRHVFDPFFTTRRSQGGTGLGLHIVYNLVTRQLGGRIVLQSSPGRGTTFKITLPLKAPPEVAAEQSPTSAGAARDQPTGS